MGMSSSKEESEEAKMKKMASAALKKLAPEVYTLEKRFEALKRDFDRANDEGTAGKQRKAFLAEITAPVFHFEMSGFPVFML